MSRIGKFTYSYDLIRLNPNIFKELMGECIVLRAEFIWDNSIEYVAECDMFRDIPEGQEVPTYIIIRENHKWRAESAYPKDACN